MRILVVSDVHANLSALDAVLAGAGAFDRIWCLGDLVGYGADPDGCIDRLRTFEPLCLAGNHDLAALGRLSLEDFNPDAKAAALWTRTRIGQANLAWLGSLPTMLAVTDLDITLVHGSPIDPIWDYVISPGGARASFGALRTRHCFNGHTHVPLVYRESGPARRIFEEAAPVGGQLYLSQGRLLVNPGSVGQPRDGDPRACYGILDTEVLAFTQGRLVYDIARTQRGMREAGLPAGLIDRLRVGR
jgi:diadenosine tetraphosphatase ApaH/serine/threonine PP2A family protein phosphatase